MTEKERATKFLRQHRISGADFTYTTGFDNMVGLLEAYAAQQSKMPTDRDLAIEVAARFLSNPHPKQRANYDREKKQFINGAKWVIE